MAITTEAIVKEIITISEDIKEYVLRPEKYKKFQPGQFLQLALGTVEVYEMWPDSRAFSIANVFNVSEGILKVIIKKGSGFTSEIFDKVTLGGIVTIKYPLGDFFINDNCDNLIFIAAGTGITPFLSYIGSDEFYDFKGSLNLFYSSKKLDELVHKDEIIDLFNKKENFRYHFYITGNEEIHHFMNGRIKINDICCIAENKKNSKVYICGPSAFTFELSSELKVIGFQSVLSEEWA